MLPTDPGRSLNLTADAELAGLTKGHGITQVLTRPHLAISIHAIDGVEAIAEGAEADIVYVIISGYGVLRCRDGARIEFTAGDVMIVPAGPGTIMIFRLQGLKCKWSMSDKLGFSDIADKPGISLDDPMRTIHRLLIES